jgi:crossover junction endodeoxyribonuclease RuvC
MSSQRILGADLGIRGSIVVIEITDSAAPVIVMAVDIPVVGSGAKERVDCAAIRDCIVRYKPTRAYLERAGAMPRQGVSSVFKYGRAAGAIEAAITLSEIPAEFVEPSVWKRFFKLPGKDKELARQKALQLFPAAHLLFSRKKDHGRAEAALIALFGARL